jgi:FHA domain-containing protein
MAPQSNPQQAEPSRRPARDLIDAVIASMRNNLEPLKYSTLAPSRYVVYLHADEFARIEGIVPVLQEQTARALAEELEALNRRPGYRKYFDRLAGPAPPVENVGREWQIDFLPDPDGEVGFGDILIHSELVLPASPDELGAGQRTRRITTVHVGHKTTRREETVSRTQSALSSACARLRYEDNAGAHTFDMLRDSVTIGRGGIAYPADVRIDASIDVSREHARIRRDAQSGAFFIVDLSTLGTTVNGRRVPKGYDEVDGTKKENGVETPLTTGSRIGLADTVYLDFDILGRQ